MTLDPTDIPYRVFARDEDLLLVAEMDSLTEIDAERRFNALGGWSLTIAADAPGVSLLAESDGTGRLIGEKRGIVVLDADGGVVFSGPVTEAQRTGDGYDEQQGVSGDMLELSGSCDNAFLARRVARPDPAGPPYATDYDERAGLADAVMQEYVDFTLGNQATLSGHPERQMTGLIIPPASGLGTTVAWKARFDNLLELLQSIAAAGGGLRFEIIQYDLVNGLVQFVATQPADKSAVVVFDPETGTLSSRTRTEQAPGANYVIALAGGEGTQRAMTERGDPDSISRYGLRETTVDARDTDDVGVAGQKIDEALAQSKESIAVEVDAIDTDQVQFGRDYGLGDIVTCRVRIDANTVEETVGYVSAITLRINRDTAADNGVGMIVPTIQTLGTVLSSGGEIGGRSGGLAGYLSRNVESETPGTVKLWAGAIASIPPRYQYMNGTAGTTDMRGRAVVGADGDFGSGGSYPLFATGGAATAGLTLAHSHGLSSLTIAHTHGPGTLTFAHDHGPGTLSLPHRHDHLHTVPDHLHTVPDHLHTVPDHGHTNPTHNHLTNIDHGHLSAQVTVAGSSGAATVQSGAGASVASTTHNHPGSAVAATGVNTNTASGNQSSGGNATDNKTGMSTDNKTGMSTDNKTGMSTNATSGTTMDISSTQTATGATGSAQNIVTGGATGPVVGAVVSGGSDAALGGTTSVPTVSPYRALSFIQRTAVA